MRSMILRTALLLLAASCTGTDTGNPKGIGGDRLIDVQVSACKSSSDAGVVNKRLSFAADGSLDGRPPECVSYRRIDAHTLRLVLSDIRNNCGKRWQPRVEASEGALDVTLLDHECLVYRCECPYDIAFTVSNLTLGSALKVRLGVDDCGAHEATRELMLELKNDEGTACFSK